MADEANPQVDMGGVDTQAQDIATATTIQQTDNQVNYEKRFQDTQSAFTKSQQELAETRRQMEGLKGQVDQLSPYYEHNKKFFNPESQKPRSVWEREDGIDGAFSDRDQVLSQMREELTQTREMVAQSQLKDLADDFVGHQKRLYQEFGSSIGSEEDFGEILKMMPKYDPSWQNNYLSSPTYDSLKRSYMVMRGAAEYDSASPLSKALHAQKQADFLRKQSNYLGSGQSIQYGPDQNKPNNPYMTPLEPF